MKIFASADAKAFSGKNRAAVKQPRVRSQT